MCLSAVYKNSQSRENLVLSNVQRIEEKDGVKHQKLKVRASTIKFLPQGDRLGGGPQRHEAPVVPNSLESDPDDIPF